MTAYISYITKLILDTFLFCIFYMAIFRIKLSSIIKRLPPLLLMMIPTALIAVITDSYLVFTLTAWAYSFIFYSLLFRLPAQKIIYGYAISHISVSIIQLVIVIVIRIFSDTPFTDISTYVAEAICYIFALIMYKFAHLDKVYNSLIVKNKVSRYIILLVFIFMLLMTVYMRISVKDFLNGLMALTVIIILILTLYAGMYRNYLSMLESQKQVQSYRQYLPIVENLIDQVRMRQHDYNNELQAIGMLPVIYTDYDSLSKAISDEIGTSCADHVIQNSYLLNINMKLIAGFLFNQMNVARERQIDLQIDLKNSSLTSSATEFELLDIMSILVDNAFDATDDGGWIKITIDSDGKATTVETFNAGPQLTADMRKNFFAKGYSTKPLKDGTYSRGIGLYKLKQLTAKYHGDILLDNQMVGELTCIHFFVKI